MIDNALPIVGPLLQRAYNDDQRRRRDALADAYPAEMAHMRWPKRRSSKRRPIPGVIDVPTDSEG